ncbi:SigE family RNA polymerase sigma factor [Longispora albida]|uniref:SigE family RNA polymerase sigma factor n=1 Tax=Longispora albida TaxID=203523 RepID=UPI000372DDE2|nr:SigE family RNA polymerase sigma factor [Longispora albida]
MTDNVRFEEFVGACSPRLLRLGYVLTRDHALAEDLLQTALAKSWPVWPRISADPEPYVRKVMANTFTTWWRRRWNGERPAAELPEPATATPHTTVDDRDEIWRALARLPRQQRAVLALRYLEDLTESQIAEALGISPGSVKNYASKALAKLRLDPTLRPGLPELPDTPPGPGRLSEVQARIRRRRTTRLVTAGAACVAVLLLITAYLLIPGFRPISLPPAEDGRPPAEVGFSDGRDGYVMVKAERGPLGARDVGFTWTPRTLNAKVFPYCEISGAWREPFVCAVYIDDVHHSEAIPRRLGADPEPGTPSTGPGSPLWSVNGIHVVQANLPHKLKPGKPVRVTIRVRFPDRAGTMQPPPSSWSPPPGWMAIAIGESLSDVPGPS